VRADKPTDEQIRRPNYKLKLYTSYKEFIRASQGLCSSHSIESSPYSKGRDNMARRLGPEMSYYKTEL